VRPEDLEALLGAYALDAVDDDERRAVEDYLATNPRARAEVQQHREVATMLAFTGAPAPEGLWDRIAASLEGQPPEPGPELAKVLPMSRRRRRERWILAGLAAVVVALIALLSVGFVQRGRQVDAERARADAQATIDGLWAKATANPKANVVELRSSDGALSARAVVQPDGTGLLAAQDLPALQDKDYQLWGIIGDQVISLGLLGERPEVVPFSAAGNLRGLAITAEQPGGVVTSQQQPLLQGAVS